MTSGKADIKNSKLVCPWTAALSGNQELRNSFSQV